MKVKTKRAAIVLCMFLCALLLVAIPVIGARAAVEWSEYEIASQAFLGETLVLPEVTASSGGETQKARSFVYSPDGNAVEKTSVLLEIEGVYEIEYRAVFSGKLYTRRHSVEVGSRVVTTTLPSDTIAYKADSAAGKAGLEVTMGQGSTLQVNQAVDLRRYTKDVPVLELYITPAEADARDFAGMRITMTDVYDSSNSVVIDYSARTDSQERGFSTVYAGSGGVLKGENPADGQVYEASEGDGSIIATSFYGGESLSHSLQLRYDNIGNIVYGAARTDSMQMGTVTLSSRIADVDSAAQFASPFGGFRTGEVMISVEPYNFSGKTATFVITQIAGADLSSGNFVSEPEVPQITVDYGDYTAETIPFALAGKSYALFDAATDTGVRVERRVYRDYYASSRVEFDIVDGAFTPDRAGNYSLVFLAKGNYGNVTEKVVPIRVYDEDTIPAQDRLQTFVESTQELTGTAGIAVALPAQSYEGGTGKVTLSVAVRDAQGKETACAANMFMPEQEGEYTIVFYAHDYAGQVATAEVPCSIAPNADPVFHEEIHLPKYMIAGKEYVLPECVAIQHGAQRQEIEAEISVTGGSLQGNVFVPDANASTAEIRYTAVSATGSAVMPFSIPVVNVMNGNSLDLSKYFHTVNLTAQAESNYINYTVADISAQSARMDFIMPLFAAYFSVDLFTVEGSNNVSSIDIVLTDSIEPSQQIFLRILRGEDGKASVSVNGTEEAKAIGSSFNGNAQNAYMTVGYDEGARAFVCDSRSLVVTSCVDGSVFTGFSSRMVYLEIRLNGVDGAAAVGIRKVNNQILTKVVADTIAPQIINEDFFGTYEIGTELVISPAYAADVVDPNVEFTLTVTDFDGNIVTATDGTVLDGADPGKEYTVLLDKYGTYSFIYNAKDTSGRTYRYPIGVNVADDAAPVIRVEQAYDSKVKAGTKITLHAASVTDNVDEDLTCSVFVKAPSGRIEMITADSFTPETAGEYTLTYFAMDSAGNIATLSYRITVE